MGNQKYYHSEPIGENITTIIKCPNCYSINVTDFEMHYGCNECHVLFHEPKIVTINRQDMPQAEKKGIFCNGHDDYIDVGFNPKNQDK